MLSIRHFSIMLACGSALCSLAGQATVQELISYYVEELDKRYNSKAGGALPEEKKLSELLFSDDESERKAGATLLYNAYNKSYETALNLAKNDNQKFLQYLNRPILAHFFGGCAHFLRSCRDLTPSEKLMGDEIRSMFNVDKILVLDLSSLAQAADSNFSSEAKLLAQLGLSYLSDPQSLTDEQETTTTRYVEDLYGRMDGSNVGQRDEEDRVR